PNAVLRLLAAGVGFLAMPVAETGAEPQRDLVAGRNLAELLHRVGRAAANVRAMCDNQVEGISVADILGVDMFRRLALRWVTARGATGRQGPLTLARADRVDHDAITPHEVENRQVRTGFLRETNGVERPQVFDPLDDLGGIVNVRGRAELAGQGCHVDAGDL